MTVFRSDLDVGPRVYLPNLGSRYDVYAHQINQPGPAQADARFGAALFATELGALPGYPRLIIGSPGWDGAGLTDSGRLSVTTPAAANGFSDPLAGNYDVDDSGSITRPARLLGTNDGYVLVIDAFSLEIRDGGGALCASGDFSGSVNVPIISAPMLLSSGGALGTNIVIEDANGNEVVTLPTTITHNSGAGELSLSITEPRIGGVDPWTTRSCLPLASGVRGDPFILDSFSAVSCN